MASDHRPKMIEPVGICELFTAFRPASAEVTSQEASSLPKARVLVVVRDSGPGLDSTQLQRVFETYYTTKSQGNGHGTGDQPFDYRSSRRPALGEKEYASWCAV